MAAVGYYTLRGRCVCVFGVKCSDLCGSEGAVAREADWHSDAGKNEESVKLYIVGNAGSGKSTFSKYASRKYNIDYFELDKIIWDSNWNKESDEKSHINFMNFIEHSDSWIIDGYGNEVFFNLSCQLADIIIVSCPSIFTSVKLAFFRWVVAYMRRENPAPIYKVLRVIFWFKRSVEPDIFEAVYRLSGRKKIIFVKNICDFRNGTIEFSIFK